MPLNQFKQKWKSLEELTKSAHDMQESGDDDSSFNASYGNFRRLILPVWRPLFQDYNPNSPHAQNTKQVILGHALGYQRGETDNVLNFSMATGNLEAILDGAKNQLGDRTVGLVIALEPKVNTPASFVNMIRDYRDSVKPLSKENPQPEKVKREMKQYIENIVVGNANPDVAVIANAIKALYDNESFAIAAYTEIKVKPKEEALVNSINRETSWKDYMRGQLGELSKPEKLEYLGKLYNIVK